MEKNAEGFFVKACRQCGKTFKTPFSKKKLCNECLETNRAECERRHKEWREQRKKEGMCTYCKTCPNKAMPGHSTCESHLQLQKRLDKMHRLDKKRLSPTRIVTEQLKLYEEKDMPMVTTAPQPVLSKVGDMLALFKKLDNILQEEHQLASRLVQLTNEKEKLEAMISEKIK